MRVRCYSKVMPLIASWVRVRLSLPSESGIGVQSVDPTRERARHHRGLALALSGSEGAEVGKPSIAPDVLSHEAQAADHANAITLSGSPCRYRRRMRGRHAGRGTRGSLAPGTYSFNLC